MADSEKDDGAAVLVGRFIRSYRYDAGRNGRRLSQEGLLELMVERGESYAANLDRVNVSYWETGAKLAPREFLVAFGRAFDIPQGEMDRMLSLAGYADLGEGEGRAAVLAAAESIGSKVESLHRDVRILVDSTAKPEPVDAYGVARDALRRMALPGLYALGVGFVLDAMGLNGTLALLAYVLAAFAIVIGQGVLRWTKPGRDPSERDQVVDLFFISLFFTLNSSLLIGVLTKADHFGFYTIEPYTNTPMPFVLTTLVNLALSLAASVTFSVLWTRNQGPGGGRSAFSRAVWTTLPPLLFTYVSISIFTSLGAWISLMVVFGVLFGTFTTIVALNQPGMALEDVNFVLRAAVVVIALLCSFGVAGALAAYLEPGMMVTASELRIIPLPEISAEELGYTPEQGVELLRLGNLWMSLAIIVYLATVVGGYLLVTIRRAADSNQGD